MKIGVVSDTHSKDVPKEMLKDFKGVDFIIHVGDFCSLDDLKVLTKIKEVKGVYGNMDDEGVCKKFPRRQIIKVDEINIGLYHGHGPAKRILESVQIEFEKDIVDVIIFGHSHQPMNEVIDNVLYFNPGSPNDTIVAPFCSYGILEINGDQIKGRIIKV